MSTKVSCASQYSDSSQGAAASSSTSSAVPEALPAVLGERDVLLVAGLEDEAHGGAQTFLRIVSPNRPFGLTISITSTTT
jgi:hypothetical protein